MCGITGSVNWGERSVLTAMTDTLRHRGPDDCGIEFFEEHRVGLGHRRLSIIDLSPAGHQPMSNGSGKLWLVFNGEIYNFPELRQELVKLGHRFKSQTDTEVILHLYESEGRAGIQKLEGMFAFALLDRPARKLVLARDALGIKPLYYYHHDGRFLFGSEIKAILAAGAYSPDLNWQGLYDFLTFNCVPGPHTMFAGIDQLPPAHTLELDLDSDKIRLERFWSPGQSTVGERWSSDDATMRLRELLTESVRAQMISDVPLGAFLGGGVDSPILVGLMAQLSSKPVKTFTVSFQGQHMESYDEREAARKVAEHFATEHHEITVNAGRPYDILRLVEYFDQPFANPTSYLMYLICSATRPEATVAICGAGGDELFAGYPRYRAVASARWLRFVPKFAFEGARGLLSLIPDRLHNPKLRRIRQLVDGIDADFASQYTKWTYYLNEEEKKALLRDNHRVRELSSSDRVVRRYLDGDLTDLNRVLGADVQTFLVDNLLEYTDKMSMAASVEVRVPFLDRRVVDHSFNIPFEDKLRGSRSKITLKQAFSDLLPAANAVAPKKGFVAPLALWINEALGSYFDRFMTRAATLRQGIFDWDYLESLRGQHRAGRCDYSYELYGVIMFDLWYRRYILGDCAAVDETRELIS